MRTIDVLFGSGANLPRSFPAMNLEKVSYLITAIEAGSFSLAAEKLGMTQSGLNRQITSLEDELKTTLLLRGQIGRAHV